MFPSCILISIVLGLTPYNDTPSDVYVFKCKKEYRYMVDKKEVLKLSNVGSEDLIIYREVK